MYCRFRYIFCFSIHKYLPFYNVKTVSSYYIALLIFFCIAKSFFLVTLCANPAAITVSNLMQFLDTLFNCHNIVICGNQKNKHLLVGTCDKRKHIIYLKFKMFLHLNDTKYYGNMRTFWYHPSRTFSGLNCGF